MARYRFTWFGSEQIFVCPCSVPFGNRGQKVIDFDLFTDIVKGPYKFPKGVYWETDFNDVSTFKLFKKKGLHRCVRNFHLAPAELL